jgi:hypothetical protein
MEKSVKAQRYPSSKASGELSHKQNQIPTSQAINYDKFG